MMLALRGEEEAGIPWRGEHKLRTFPNKETELKDAEEGNRVMEEPVRTDEVLVSNDLEASSPWRVEHSWWCWHDGAEEWMDEVEGSLSMAEHMRALGCPCGWVPEPAARVEYSLEELDCSSGDWVIGRTLQGGGSSEPGNGSPEPWPALVHDRLELGAAWWNSWVGGRSLGQGCRHEVEAEGDLVKLPRQQT